MVRSLFFFALTLALAATAVAQNTPPPSTNELKQLAFKKLALVATDNRGQFLIPTWIGKSEAVGFIVDSGCARPFVVAKSLAEKLDVKVRPDGTADGIGGTMQAGIADFDNIVFARHFEISGKAIRVLDLANISFIIQGKIEHPSGLLGAEALAQCRFVFDYAESCLLAPPNEAPRGSYLQHAKTAGDHVFAMTKGPNSFPFISVTFNGKTYAFLVDTGAGYNTIDPELAKKLDLHPEATDKGTSGGGSGNVDKLRKLQRVTIDKPIIADKLNLANMHLYLVAAGQLIDPPEGQTFGGILGADTLGYLKARLDFDSYSLIIPKSVGSTKP